MGHLVSIARRRVEHARLLIPVFVMLLLAAPGSATLAQESQTDSQTRSQTQSVKSTAPPDEWKFTAGPYAWAIGIIGDVGVGSRSTDVDASFIDVLKDSDSLVALQGHFEVQHRRWGLFFDGSYAEISASFHDQGRFVDLSADVDTKLVFLEAGTFFRVVDGFRGWQPSGDIGGGLISADLLAGARYTNLSLDTEARADAAHRAFKRDFDTNQDWVDPFVGARVEVGVTDSIVFSLRGDIGGFGVGSELTWNTQALFGYRFKFFDADAVAGAGYRAMGQDYENHSGRDFTWDVILHGPVIGLVFRW